MKYVRALLLVAFAGAAHAQLSSWDTSGNGMLNGTYYFRHVIYILGGDANGNPNGSLYDAAAAYGSITFDGKGGYKMHVTLADAQAGQPQTGDINNGTYSIAASGQGFLSNPFSTGDYIYGLVNAQGIFAGSSTDNANFLNDLFIAAPLASPNPTASSFKGSYTLAYMDLSGGDPRTTFNAMVQMNPDGAGNLGTVSLTGYAGQSGSSKITQSISGAKYTFSNGAAVVTFPNSNSNLFSGQYYLYFSPDGNFVFGGSPSSYDVFVGVRNPSGTQNLSGLYYEAGIDEDTSTLGSGYATLDTFYGSFAASSGAIIGHQRLNNYFNDNTVNYTFSDSYNLAANGTYSSTATTYLVSNGIRIASGIGPYLGISVALQSPSIGSNLSTTGVFLNPTGVVNAASSAPFTADIAPGELLTLYGSNLASGAAIASAVPFPTTLNKVQVMINGITAPIYYVTPGQLSVIVPYGITSSVAKIQVFNDNVASNTVTMFVSNTAPGVLTQSQNGLGYGDAVHQDGTLVNSKNPAKIGETVSVFVTGLGAVSPAIGDGDVGPVNPLSTASAVITAFVGGVKANVSYAGLAPQLAGLYQINLTIPTGLTAGDNGLDISAPDGYSAECLIAIAGASSSPEPAATRSSTRTRKIPDAVGERGPRKPKQALRSRN